MWLESLETIYTLDISYTGISDAIPFWFWNFSTIREIDLSNNQIYGELLDSQHLFVHFFALYLSSNKLKGPLPRIPAFALALDL